MLDELHWLLQQRPVTAHRDTHSIDRDDLWMLTELQLLVGYRASFEIKVRVKGSRLKRIRAWIHHRHAVIDQSMV